MKTHVAGGPQRAPHHPLLDWRPSPWGALHLETGVQTLTTLRECHKAQPRPGVTPLAKNDHMMSRSVIQTGQHLVCALSYKKWPQILSQPQEVGSVSPSLCFGSARE